MILGWQARQNQMTNTGEWNVLIGSFWNVLSLHIPVGYQDDTGFHFGEESAPHEFEI
jgi:hypothetical protein